jgi:hypothetical protein
MYLYELNIQLEGLGVSNIPTRMNDVYFQNIEGRLYASCRFESEFEDEIPEETLLEATDLLHEAVLRLNYIYKFKISLSNGYTLKRLFNHEHPWITLSTMTFPYSIGVNHDKLAEDISLLSSDMNTILNKALGYYEAALESTNPYVKTILMVSCALSLIKEICQINRDVTMNDLKKGLDEIRKRNSIADGEFDSLISNIYAKGRSRAAHGNVDIKSNTEFSFLTKDYELFHQMVRELIVGFINRNQGNMTTIPKT